MKIKVNRPSGRDIQIKLYQQLLWLLRYNLKLSRWLFKRCNGRLGELKAERVLIQRLDREP